MTKEETMSNRATKPRKGSIKDEVLRFAMLSSIRGLSRILRSRSLIWRAFWLVFVTTSLFIAIVLATNVIGSYLRYDTIQELREHYNSEVPFPSVTVCNSQAIDKDRYERLNESLVEGLFHWLEILRQSYGSSESLLEDRYFLFENLGRNLSHQVGLSLDTLFLKSSCSFTYLNTSTGKDHYKSCFDNDVRMIQTPRYFNCFMLTPSPEIINFTTDLKFDLFLNVPDMMEHHNITHLPYNEDDTTGARISIHSPLSWPYTSEVGIDIEPGTKTMIDLSPSILKFLPHQGDQVCNEREESYAHLDAEVGWGSREFAYSRNFCTDLLQQHQSLKKCGCIDPRKPHSPTLTDISFCGKVKSNSSSSINETLMQLHCADNLELDAAAIKVAMAHDSVCPLTCQAFQYKYQTSQSLWPTKNKEVDFYQQILRPIPALRRKFIVYEEIYNLSQSRSDMQRSRQMLLQQNAIRDNFVRLHIFRDDFSASERRMMLKTSSESMISQVGGIFHLLTGITFACVVELFECMYYVAKKLLSNQWTDHQTNEAAAVCAADEYELQMLQSANSRSQFRDASAELSD